MAKDWYDIKFLESASNVKGLVARSTGRCPNTQIAREISACLQQGRLYFEAASAAPLQISPLLIYYGVVAFAQGVVVARRGASLSTLKPGHGLRHVTASNARIEDLTLEVQPAGTFIEFNDAIAPLGRIWYSDASMPRWFKKRFDCAASLEYQKLGLRDILARVPRLAEKYRHTFSAAAKAIPVWLNISAPEGRCSLSIDEPDLFDGRVGLVEMLRKLRETYPFLEKWHFVNALHQRGFSVLNFSNLMVEKETTLEDDLIDGVNGSFENRKSRMMLTPPNYVAAPEILPPLSGGYVKSDMTYAMEPVAGVNVNEHSLQFLGTFLLSSLVRYRPLTWQAALSRSVSANGRADDRALALVEEFLDGVLSAFPAMVVRTIDYERIL